MDRLRSLQYFIASAEEGSFSAAARRLDVTIPAVAKMVNGLERDLGIRLFERSAHGLALTAAGEGYLESCKPAVEALRDADEQMRASATRARGTVVVGVQHVAATHLLAPALARFHARHADILIDLRESTQLVQPDAPGIDVYLSYSWPKAPDMIHRTLTLSRFRVCAAPSYWAAAGMPQDPRDLVRHTCLLIRTQTGLVLDVWKFRRGDETVEVTVKGWFVCNNSHRASVISLARQGEGVVRVLDWANRPDIEEGSLVSALADWESVDAPPVTLSYRPSARRVARVRLFIEFVLELFRELESPKRLALAPAPAWAGVKAARLSTFPGARRR